MKGHGRVWWASAAAAVRRLQHLQRQPHAPPAPACRRGTDLELPFQCPLDFLVPIPALDASGLQYRMPGFLQLPQVPAALRASRAVVVIAAGRPADPFPPAAKLAGHAATVWSGIRQGDLVRAVQPVAAAAVLELRCGRWGDAAATAWRALSVAAVAWLPMPAPTRTHTHSLRQPLPRYLHARGRVPGFLGGFDEPAAAAAFDRVFGKATEDYGKTPFWCCFSWGDADDEYRRLLYAPPPPLAGACTVETRVCKHCGEGTDLWAAPQGPELCCLPAPSFVGSWAPWEPPAITSAWPLEWCDRVSEAHGNRGFTLLPQHPCAFGRNATAAALAAGSTGRDLLTA